MTEKQILKSIKALAKDECANYKGGMCLETEKPCHLINPEYETIQEGTIDCDYFWECVLPADWDLNDLVSYAMWYDGAEEDMLPPDMKRCEICQTPFTPRSNRQRFCSECGAYMRTVRINEKQRRYRQYKKVQSSVTL